MNILLTICARGGSKGIPGKNIKLLAGRPLIEYTLIIARQFINKYKNAVIAVSSDSSEIIDFAVKSGIEVPYKRPEIFATDKAGKIGAISDILMYYENLMKISYEYILDLDVTSPLRSLRDLSEAFSMIEENPHALNLFSVSPANRNPYFNMVEQGQDNFYHLVKNTGASTLSRQSAPKVYDLNASFYYYKRSFFDSGLQSAVTDKSLVYVVPHMCFDLDHPVDFEFLAFLIENNKLDFEWL